MRRMPTGCRALNCPFQLGWLHCLEKYGRQTTKMVSYCAYHRVPNPDTVLIIQTPVGVFSTKSLVQNKKRAGTRLISSSRVKPKSCQQKKLLRLSHCLLQVVGEQKKKLLHTD